ncbi:hypothetical protein [Chamaesiphon sp.]
MNHSHYAYGRLPPDGRLRQRQRLRIAYGRLTPTVQAIHSLP